MSYSTSKAKDVKSKARVAYQPLLLAWAQKNAKNEEDEKKIQHATFNHMLEQMKHDPQIFQRKEMKYLSEFVNHDESLHDIYPCNPHDLTTCPVLCSNISHPLSKNFIAKMIANTFHSENVFNHMYEMWNVQKSFLLETTR